MSVIDAALRFSQNRRVLTHDEIMAELLRRLDEKSLKGVAVARHLGIEPPRITEMRNGKRQIQPNEMAPLARFLGMVPADVSEDTLALPDDKAIVAMWHQIDLDDQPAAYEMFASLARKGSRKG